MKCIECPKARTETVPWSGGGEKTCLVCPLSGELIGLSEAEETDACGYATNEPIVVYVNVTSHSITRTTRKGGDCMSGPQAALVILTLVVLGAALCMSVRLR